MRSFIRILVTHISGQHARSTQQDAFADIPIRCNAAHFWWLVEDTLVVAFGLLPEIFLATGWDL